MKEIKTHTLLTDLTSEEYHSTKGYSSSQLKDLLDDPEYFYKKYILKTEEKLSIPAFDVGTYFHSSILEPEKLLDDCAVFTGKIRRGKEWDEFKEKNVGKAIVTVTEMEQAEGLANAVRNSPIAMGRIERSRSEISLFVELHVSMGEIFCAKSGRVLGPHGWEEPGKRKTSLKDCVPLLVKVRADKLGDDFVLDLKSTTGNAKSVSAMRKKISDYNYDLSASLYLDMFSLVTETTLSDFIWTFASKDYYNCKSYMASRTNVQVGRAKYKKALLTLAYYIKTNWEFEDSMGILEPNIWELEIIQPKGEDLL